MIGVSTSRRQVQFVDEGLVRCPVLHRDVDIERCLGCRRLEHIDLDSRHPHVVCRLDGYADADRRG